MACRALTSVWEVPALLKGFSFPQEEDEDSPGRSFQALGPVGLQSLELSQEVGGGMGECERHGEAEYVGHRWTVAEFLFTGGYFKSGSSRPDLS